MDGVFGRRLSVSLSSVSVCVIYLKEMRSLIFMHSTLYKKMLRVSFKRAVKYTGHI